MQERHNDNACVKVVNSLTLKIDVQVLPEYMW